MNIKSLLLGSAAAMAVVSGAQAADAIVAAEPEPMEYVRVCDAFGKGYFYIPGTETCLKIGGYVRTEFRYRENSYPNGGDIDAYSRGYLTFAAKNDTEFGAVSSYINLQADTEGDAFVDGAWINVAGFDVGYFYNWWDDGLSGETDELGSNLFNAIRYTYDGGTFLAGVAVEELDSGVNNKWNDNIGVSGKLGFTLGAVKADVIASYDFDAEEAAFRGMMFADVGPGTFGLSGIYATNPNAYYSAAEWTVAAEYAIKATDKVTITPAAQYFGNVNTAYRAGTLGFIDTNPSARGSFSSSDAWKVGVTAGYKITEGLRTLATVNYVKFDDAPRNVDDSKWTGFLRLQRDF
ncbi:hypothetical protein BJF92_02445 [Rhizobium rhizosphaerae]|uniref:Porin n=1 Tax=Xaviernesmea rhizosphaerae TaxID=1672749 RepID=A0A1Q9AL63_9HYPH|nr:porin [Xaviernesmea rhizosphaerae]OLP55984.1 hypothetical protein BJF92_02445 [Xaviernesmea rhizosphaerae]OQP85634.1 hypothetical protein BTR14_14235 [Xaviernesmea rhizosphaerae]